MKWLRVLLLVCALPLQAETVTIPNLAKQPQERSLWCWAAVSSIAISAFHPVGSPRRLSQLDVVARRRAEAFVLQDDTDRKTEIEKQFNKCKPANACDLGDEPLLFDIDSRMLESEGKFALKMKAFKIEIDQKRPVIIRWSFTDTSVAANAASGTHALIVTGYSTDPDRLLVYDPLPLRSKSANRARRVVRETWIPYDRYLNASHHDGLKIVPLHEYDTFRMRPHNARVAPEPLDRALLVNVSPVETSSRPPGGFEEPRTFRGINQNYVDRVQKEGGGFLRPDGKRRTGRIESGNSIPVVALEARSIVGPGARAPDSLLVPRANAYVVPVLEGTEVVDSFMLLEGANHTWSEGGYSSPGVTSLLAQLAADPKNQAVLKKVQGERNARDDFYLVSVPELGAYFLAHGFGADARLKSLDDDGAGEFLTPTQAFKPLIETVRLMQEDLAKRGRRVTPR